MAELDFQEMAKQIGNAVESFRTQFFINAIQKVLDDNSRMKKELLKKEAWRGTALQLSKMRGEEGAELDKWKSVSGDLAHELLAELEKNHSVCWETLGESSPALIQYANLRDREEK